MRSQLVDVDGVLTDGRLSSFSGYLEVEPVQEGRADGLVATVGLQNRGDDAITLINPFALLQFEVQDGEGFPLNLAFNPPPPFVNTAGGEDWSAAGSYPIQSVRRNGHSIDPSVLGVRTIPFASHDEYAVTFEISIPDGTYSLGVLVNLIPADTDHDHPNESRLLHGDQIQIHFRPRH